MRTLLFVLLFLLSTNELVSQTDDFLIVSDEQLSLSFGLGLEYSLVGIRGTYKLNKFIRAIGSFSPLLIWTEAGPHLSMGVECIVPKRRLNFDIYTSFQFSNQSHLLEAFNRRNFDRIIEREKFLGGILSLGLKIPCSPWERGTISCGLNYNFDVTGELSDAINEFNVLNSSFNGPRRQIWISVGYAYFLKK